MRSERSGGQQPRVAIARAIASENATVLADKLTAKRRFGYRGQPPPDHGTTQSGPRVTLIFSTHDPKVMAHARRLVHLVDVAVDSDEIR